MSSISSTTLKLILQGVSDEACFELMVSALDKGEFLFVREFCDPAWKLSATRPKYSSDFMTALLFSMMRDYSCELAVVQFLCNNYEIDVNSVDLQSTSLFDTALSSCDLNVAEYLVKRGANPALKTGKKEGKYHYILRTAPRVRVLEIFNYLDSLGIEVDYAALPYAVFQLNDDSTEIISWLVEHGHGHYAGGMPFHAEAYLLRDAVLSAIRKDKFRTSVWLDKLDALLRSGIEPNPVVENDFGHAMRLIDYVNLQIKRYPDTAPKVAKLLKRYND